ncbi:molybdopterin-dependent oxidoreductase [Actinomadura sp. HBU206391]|uniref:molybdopterin-dependent oxidoreductase n=1 Tax=Actinomadura sp. HBU206391 TaxID=2731692 RepID=UPI00165008FD|nr:molybdopterin-dependent oxidoreductase [Actinomadura sp. HBU206391]MBC6457868.1 molybdopterin-dependent oxidoreductase [Actinomadura sp. HBU206391]
MAAHRRPARRETAPGDVLESLLDALYSRRRFLTSSAIGTAGSLVLGTGVAAEAAARGETTASRPSGEVGKVAEEADRVVQATPSRYFVNRGNGSEEMKWGPARDYAETVPNDRFYIHNRARPPDIDRRTWRLRLTGDALARPRSFGYEDLLALPAVTLRRTLDCGANCRVFFPSLPPSGDGRRWLPIGFTQWHFGAVSAAEWTGVRVKDVLAAAGARDGVDVKFTGLDEITDPDGRTVNYSQVIPFEKAVKDDTLLAYRMNGADLPVDHGYPLRALFSGWGGNTAVKWLGHIEASKRSIPAAGPQRLQVLTGPDFPEPVRPTAGRVRSAVEFNENVTLTPGDMTLRGRAWSGAGAIDRVDVQVDRLVAPGRWTTEIPWREAKLLSAPEPFMWVRFEVPWQGVKPGKYRVMSRARDRAGNVQPRPEDVLWNQHGLEYNGHAPLELVVLPASLMP